MNAYFTVQLETSLTLKYVLKKKIFLLSGKWERKVLTDLKQRPAIFLSNFVCMCIRTVYFDSGASPLLYT